MPQCGIEGMSVIHFFHWLILIQHPSINQTNMTCIIWAIIHETWFENRNLSPQKSKSCQILLWFLPSYLLKLSRIPFNPLKPSDDICRHVSCSVFYWCLVVCFCLNLRWHIIDWATRKQKNMLSIGSIESKHYNFHSGKYRQKYRLHNDGHFI